MEKPLPQILWIIAAVTGIAIIIGSILSTTLIFILPPATKDVLVVILPGLSLIGLLLGLGLVWV